MSFNLDEEFAAAYDEVRKHHMYRLNFGVYYTPKNLWVA